MNVCFDFDKTLTYKDTSLGFYKICSKTNSRFYSLLPLYVLCCCLYKFNLITNDRLKSFAVKIFLKGITREDYEENCKRYSKKVKLNNILDQLYIHLREGCDIYIITASFSLYVSEVFSDLPVSVRGSELLFINNKIVDVKMNCYGAQKVEEIRKNSITRVDYFYTDSYSDYPMMQICENNFIVKRMGGHLYRFSRVVL